MNTSISKKLNKQLFRAFPSFNFMKTNARSSLYLIVIVILATVSARSVNNMISTTMPLLSRYQLLFTNSEVGALSALGFITTFISTSFINPFLSSSRRRRLFITASGLSIPLLIAYYLSNSIIIWINAIIFGFIYGLILPNLITIASMGADRKSSERLLNIYSMSLSLSLVIGPVLETLLLTRFTYRDMFLLFLPLATPLFLISWKFHFPETEKNERKSSVLKNEGLLSAILAITTYNVPFGIITTFFAIYAKEVFDVPRAIAYSIFIPFYLVSFSTRFAMSIRPFDELRRPLAISILLTAVGLMIVALAPSFYIMIIGMLILGIPHGSVFPMTTIMISRATSPGERNAANSYFIAYNNVLFTVLPPLYGVLISILSFRVPILLLLIPTIVASLILYKKYWKSKIMRPY